MLQSTGGRNMLEALRLKRSEWYSSQMQVLSVWSWQNDLDSPTLLRPPLLSSDRKTQGDFLAVLWRKTRDRPAVGFSLSNNVPSGLSHPDLRG